MAGKGSNVVIAYDGSEHSEYALEWYVQHMHHASDVVTMVHVPEVNDVLHSAKWSSMVYDHQMLEAMLRDENHRIKQDLDKFAEKLKALGISGKVKSVIAHKPGEGILKECDHAQLVVVGSRGKGKLRRSLMGSVSDYIMHHCHCPVLVVKHPKHFHLHGHQEDCMQQQESHHHHHD